MPQLFLLCNSFSFPSTISQVIFGFFPQIKLQNEVNLRKKAESSAASFEEKASAVEGQLNRLSESMEREKQCFQVEIAQLKKESKFSLSRKSAEVRM